MNFRTTLVLLILAAAGAAIWGIGPANVPWLGQAQKASSAANTKAAVPLENEFAPDKLTRIDIRQGGNQIVLERPLGGEWSLPGKWPTRKQAVDEVVNVLAGISSTRFKPIPVEDTADFKNYGLDQPSVNVVTAAAGKEYRLAFGEEPLETNRFSRATYLRLNNDLEVIRLAPGLVAILGRPQEFYQQRRLFQGERVARDALSSEKADRLDAQAIAVKGPGGNYSVARKENDWELSAPVHDRVDPDKLKSILFAVPDIWAEQFVDRGKKELAEFGLKEPEQTVRVTGAGKNEIVLQIGKTSRTTTRNVTRPAPNFGGPPMPPQREVVHDEYRYAKLEGNEQIFDIKADKLKDIFVDGKSLRDAQLARFRTDEARRIEIHPGNAGADVVAVKEKDHWQLQKPYAGEAEESKITELLDKLSGLQARDKDVIDSADLKTYGFGGATALVHVSAEESAKPDAKDAAKKTKHFTFMLGKQDTEKKHVYVRVEGIDRINAVEDSLLPLVQRPALAYRSRRLLDAGGSDIARIDVRQPKEQLALEQANGGWRLAAPAPSEVDSSKVFQLANDLGRLEAVEHVSESATPQALEHTYGLAKPAATAKIAFSDAKKPAQTLLIGKQRPGKTDYFAKLEANPGIFAVKKELYEALAQDSLAYLPLQLWQLSAADIKELRIRKDAPEYRLKHEGAAWKVTGPFDAAATATLVKQVEDELASLRCERYVAHAAKDLAAYGLDKPYLRVSLQESAQGTADKKPAQNERTLLIGKPTDAVAKTRFAKLDDGKAIFVLAEKVVTALDHAATDFLDLKLLALAPGSIERIQSKGTNGSLTLQRQGEDWRVLDTPAPAFAADKEAVSAVLGLWSNLRGQRFVAYGGNVNLASYGLDKPASTVTVTVQAPAANGQPATAAKHTVALGKAADASGDRYARVDDGPGVVILGPSVAGTLTRTYLDYVNRSALSFDSMTVQRLERRMDKQALDIVKSDGGWRITTPPAQPADGPTVDALVDDLSALQAQSVAEYPARDLKTFGLDAPAATITVHLKAADGKTATHILKLGKASNNAAKAHDRYALADKSDAVIVLPGALAERLLAAPLQLRDRNLGSITAVDRVVLQRGPRKATFAKVDGTWKMTEIVPAEAEQADLDDLVNLLGRMRADELVADKPADLKAYGLDHPEAQWQFFFGEKRLAEISVGSAEKTNDIPGARHYSKLGTSTLVFLCSPQLTARLLGEYRNRTVWPALDASQIERLSFGYADHPFVLEKQEDQWHVAGRPGVTVQADAIREALDALAGLKAARYVVDKGGELKLYGLDPAQLVLDIQTPSGKRALHIGRPEGGSKRYYARVPGDNSSIFVLAEADAKRIIRSLAEWTQKASAGPKVTN